MALFNFFNRKNSELENHSAGRELITDSSHFVIVEAYKRLRTNLLFMLSDKKKIVAFTSTVPSEGKTTNCLNLAISFAKAGHKILVIDMDMRKPRVHASFNAPLSPGLSEMLDGSEKTPNIIETSYENLHILTAGSRPQTPPELLMTPLFEALINSLREEYDYIFVDTPPVYVVTDLSVVASKFDGIVYVVREKVVPLRTLKKSVEHLTDLNGKVLGFIFNDSDRTTAFAKYVYRYRYSYKYSGKYGYGKYGKYGGYGGYGSYGSYGSYGYGDPVNDGSSEKKREKIKVKEEIKRKKK